MSTDKKKNNPVGVRFGDDYEELKKSEPSVTTHQKALNFLMAFWKDNKKGRLGGVGRIDKPEHDIVDLGDTITIPVPKAGVKKGDVLSEKVTKPKGKIKLVPLPNDFKKADKIVATTSFKEAGEIARLTEQLKNPPNHLKGIDLTIWKKGIKDRISELSTPKKIL